MGRNNVKLTNYDVDMLLNELHGGTLLRVDDYINTRTPIHFKCIKHNYIWKTSPCNIFNKQRGCPLCGGSLKLTNEVIDKRLENRKIIRVGDYINLKTKILFECLSCGNKWESVPGNVAKRKKPSGCPACLYKREKQVYDILKKYFKNIKYHFFINLKGLHLEFERLYVDFYIPKINIYIEYNGEQHYKPIDFGSLTKKQAMEKFEIQKRRDSFLRTYCKSSNIELLEIPYFYNDKTIEQTLYNLWYQHET